MKIKIPALKALKLNYILIISPYNLKLIEFEENKIESRKLYKIEENIFINNNFNEANFKKALISLKNKVDFKEAILIINLPIFFTQKITVKDTMSKNLNDILETNIKAQMSFAITKYLWHPISYISKNYILVIFYNKEIIESISNILLSLTILPIKMELISIPFLEFIKNKFSLYFERSYILIIYLDNVLNFLLYENGVIQNIYAEVVDSNNVAEVCKRIIETSIKNSTYPYDITYISKSGFDIPEDFISLYKIIDIEKTTNLNTEDIITISISSILKTTVSESTFEVINLDKEIFLNKLINYLKFFSLLSIGCLIFIGSVLYIIYFSINKNNEYIKLNLNQVTQKDMNINEIEKLANALENYNRNKVMVSEKVKFILDKVKDYKVVQLAFSRNNIKIIIEESDNNKKEEIKKNIQSNIPNAQVNFIFNGLEINLFLK